MYPTDVCSSGGASPSDDWLPKKQSMDRCLSFGRCFEVTGPQFLTLVRAMRWTPRSRCSGWVDVVIVITSEYQDRLGSPPSVAGNTCSFGGQRINSCPLYR